jgi:hypothetical protein
MSVQNMDKCPGLDARASVCEAGTGRRHAQAPGWVPECVWVSLYERHPLRLQGGMRRRRVVLFRHTACLAMYVAAYMHWQGAVCSAGEEALRPRPSSVSLLGQAHVARPACSEPLVGASLRLRGGRQKF